eukprot:XP_001690051.1 predicted protein [Chlamydomonas reinhardtii]
MEAATNPEELLEALNSLIAGVGEAYIELSGQTAATQAIVADLRRCAAFLNTRRLGSDNQHASGNPAAGPPLASSSALGESGGDGSPGAGTPMDGGSRTQQGTPVAPGSSNRPPLASAGAGRGVAAGARAANRGAGTRAMAAAAAMAANSGDSNDARGTTAGNDSGGAGGTSGGHQDGSAAAATKPAGPPQLPLALRRAMQQYRETMSTREQLLQQAQRRGGGAGLSTLADTVSAASRSYCSALARLYPASSAPLAVSASMAAAQLQRVSLGRVPAGLQMQQEAVAVLRREAQVKFSALVAAQTWLTQSLTDLQRSRGAGGGVSAANRRAVQAEACAALLPEVEQLRAELAAVQAELAAAEEQLEQLQSQAAQQQRGRVGSAGAGRGALEEAASTALAALGVDYELAEAAALWRNRFLRAMLADAAPVAARAAVGAGPAGRGAGTAGRGGRQTAAQAEAAGQGGRGGLQPRDRAATVSNMHLMPRPLGMWLPDAMWALASTAAPDTDLAAASGPGPAWAVLLPTHKVVGGASHAPGTQAPFPAPVLCGSAQDAVAYGRAQQQLQATVFQLYLEGELAAPLLPRQRPPPPPLQPARGASSIQQRTVAVVAWERWLAQWRMAHLLLVKGAWNKLCSVVELEEEDEGGQGA